MFCVEHILSEWNTFYAVTVHAKGSIKGGSVFWNTRDKNAPFTYKVLTLNYTGRGGSLVGKGNGGAGRGREGGRGQERIGRGREGGRGEGGGGLGGFG